MVSQRALLFERLEVAEAAAERAEALKLVEGEKETICTKVDKLREEGRIVEAKLKKAEQENAQLKKEMEKLRDGLVAKRKEIDELQTRHGAGLSGCSRQHLFDDRRPSGWMHFLLLHLPSPGVSQVPDLRPFDPARWCCPVGPQDVGKLFHPLLFGFL
ncbi:hypothetical protein CK203_029649 [Vitis vinifera]|uniref:Uncharacterized protein n=1 Tax=Vitis vinifera TaxID=29760 RepID=A0A438III3_VITVI|nr:hypothetical protein CK203_029649 [Vitis vinifera]